MLFDIYKIACKELSRHVQYILFNYSNCKSESKLVTSFANTNVCLGIINEKKLFDKVDGVKAMQDQNGIHSYLSGMYLPPHKFEATGAFDEICIDFTPLGYYHFFKLPIKTYVLGEDVLTEGFGKDAKSFFEKVFEIRDFQKRGALIEGFLKKKLFIPDVLFLQDCLHCIHMESPEMNLKQLARGLRCSEKKIVRSFLTHFDLSPKDYMRIIKFRKALHLLNCAPGHSLTSIAHASGYYDQSHFIKDVRFFTWKSPREIRYALHDVKQQVIIGLE
jgi:AraC-like DNA-binding protein